MDINLTRYRTLRISDRLELALPIRDHADGLLGLGVNDLLGPCDPFYRPEGRFMPSGMRLQSPYFASGDPETEEYTALPVSGSTLPPAGMLGALADFNRAGLTGPPLVQRYQFVKQAAAITGIVGNVLYWSDKPNFVVTTARTNRGFLSGICRIAAANAASYIWQLKKGRRTVKFQAVTSSAPDATGKPVVCSMTTDGLADCLANDQAQAAFPLIGITQTTVTSQLATVEVNIPDEY